MQIWRRLKTVLDRNTCDFHSVKMLLKTFPRPWLLGHRMQNVGCTLMCFWRTWEGALKTFLFVTLICLFSPIFHYCLLFPSLFLNAGHTCLWTRPFIDFSDWKGIYKDPLIHELSTAYTLITNALFLPAFLRDTGSPTLKAICVICIAHVIFTVPAVLFGGFQEHKPHG